jgi:hypothetical protein
MQKIQLATLKYKKMAIILVFLSGAHLLQSQTLGSTFGISSSTNGNATLMYSIGQPFAVFQKMESKEDLNRTTFLSQGHILPTDQYAIFKEELSVKAYPNPVVDRLNVQIEKMGEIKEMKVMDINGRLMKQEIFQSRLSLESIDLSNLAAGIYFIDVRDSQGQRGLTKVTKVGQLLD